MKARALIVRLVVQTAAWLGFMGLLLFLPAGSWRWAQAWAFLAIFSVGSAVFSVWLLPRDPALLASRLGPLVQRGQPAWDKMFIAGIAPRAVFEERLLARDLAGYTDYMRRVRYRLVPGVW